MAGNVIDPMMIGLSIAGGCLLLAGVFFALKGFLSLPSEDAVVSRIDYEAAQKSIRAARENETKLAGELKAVQGEMDTLKKSEPILRAELEKIRGESADWRQKSESQLAETLVMLEQAKVENETLQAKLVALEGQWEQGKKAFDRAKEKTIEQAAGALSVINDLKSRVTGKEVAKNSTDINKQFLDKEKALQQEIAKNKTQIIGLERICEDFKKRVEHIDELEQLLQESKEKIRQLEQEKKSVSTDKNQNT